MKGVLLLAHGTPDSLDEMPEYLVNVRGGRPPTAELIEEMRHNYGAIGGRSPLTDITRAQAAALAAALGGTIPVYVGMRNWKPFIADALREAAAAGVRELVVLPLAPQYSTLSMGKYQQAVESSVPDGIKLHFVSAWHDHPRLLDAFAEKVREAAGPYEVVLFTAHSLPVRVIQEGDPYAQHVKATAVGVAQRADLPIYRVAYQSAGRTPEPWLGPAVGEALEELAAAGQRRVLLCPIGFVCDHTEILFDIDVQAQEVARRYGVQLTRTASLNTSPTFISALVDIVRRARA